MPSGRLERLTPHTILNRADLDADLADVRRRGYAVAQEELEAGLVAVSAPVRRNDGVVVAAISVSGPLTRFGAARIAEVGAQCVHEADALSAALGFNAKNDKRVGAA